jgi:dipeptidase D
VTDKTHEILDLFEALNAIPRCSKNEAAVCAWIQQWATDRNLAVRADAAGNLVIDLPATPGFEAAPTVVFQAHVDMVCEKTPDSDHDFTRDPIRHVADGDWLRARNTSLGADNGAAVAMGMALAADPDVAHPTMELLFTVDEETGLNGAQKLEPGFVSGRILLNVDSEDEGVFTVGCAGGRDSHLTLDLETGPAPKGLEPMVLSAAGMRGGHSGVDINKHRASANRVLARGLNALADCGPVQLARIKGGTTHNAIAREAEAVVVCAPGDRAAMTAAVAALEKTIRGEYGQNEPNLALSLEPAGTPIDGAVVTPAQTRTVIALLLALPHGMSAMAPDMPELVETSGNLAVIETVDGRLNILHSKRSSVMSRMDELTARMTAMATLAGASVRTGTEYPAWQPDMASPLLGRSTETYQKLFGKKPEVEIIHAGLECAIIGDTYPGMDMISFGPTMENPHSPDERLYVPSISRVWDFIAGLLASYRPDTREEKK